MFRSFLRPVAALAALSGLAAYATIMLRGPQGLNALAVKHKEIRSLEDDVARMKLEVELKKARIQRLKTDPETLEVELERIGYLHKNDTRFKTADPSVQAPVGGLASPVIPKR